MFHALLSPLLASAPLAPIPPGTSEGDRPAGDWIAVLEADASIARVTEGLPVAPERVVALGSGVQIVHLTRRAAEALPTSFVSVLSARDGVLSVEADGAVVSPDLYRCQAQGDLSIQGCTQAFYDGAPSEETFQTQTLVQLTGSEFAQRTLEDVPVVVAVIDTGIDPAHPAFADVDLQDGFDFTSGVVGGWDLANGFDDDADGLVDEAFGHGTHVASTITLLNPNAMLLPLRVLDSDGNGSAFALAEAIHFAVVSGAEVINLSLAMPFASPAVSEALDFASAMGVDVVAAAGNTAADHTLFPSTHPTVLAVAGLNYQDRLAVYSGYGPLVDISAPGTGIYAAMPDGQYAWWSGTSMAAAVATGCLSTVRSLCGSYECDLSPEGILLESARSIDSLNHGLAGLLGAGRVDAARATRDVRQF